MQKRYKLIAIVASSVVICLLIAIGIAYYYLYTPVSAKAETTYLYIDSDDDADSVYTKLKACCETQSLKGVKPMANYYDYQNNIRTGRYEIGTSDNALTIVRRLKTGNQTPINLTIPEAKTLDRLAGKLAKKLMVDSLALVNLFCDSAVCADYGYSIETMPAMFVPNTYSVYWDTSAEQLMKRISKEHKAFWNKDGRMEKAEKIGLTPVEVATLASIVDEETANKGEKPMVAGMYINRLRIKMPLQADPTIKFALKNFALRRIYNSMLKADNPYNTYKNAGLPPGPIKIASIAGIDAVLNHAEHPYLYMCAKEDFSGTHNFAKTYREHLQNAARYRKALNERNIK